MKIFRFAFSEFVKMFQKRGTFIFFAACMLTLVLCGIFFNPTETNLYQTSLTGVSVSSIHSKFTSSSEADSQAKLLQEVNNGYIMIDSFHDSIIYENIKADIDDLNRYLKTDFYNALLEVPSDISTYFALLKTKADNLTDKISDISNNTDFYIKETDRSRLESFFFGISINIPASFGTYTNEQFVEKGNFIITNYLNTWETNVTNILKNVETIKISEADFDAWEDFHTKAMTKLDALADEAAVFSSSISAEDNLSKEKIEEYSLILTRYKAIAKLTNIYFYNKIELLMAGDKTDAEIASFAGLGEFNRYEASEACALSAYFVENEEANYDEFLIKLASGKASSKGGNVYDLTFFIMQIIFILTAVYCVYLASVSFAGEEAEGTLRMIAIRPYKREKIYLGKLLSVLMVGITIMLLFMLISFVYGLMLFGLPIGPIITVVNATSVMVISGFVMILIAMALQIISLLFFVSIALLLSITIRSSVITALSSFVILIVTYVFNILFANTAWIKFLPFPHIDLFKFFGGASSAPMILEGSLYMGTNIILSTVYLGSFILIMNIASMITFKKKSL